VFPICCGQSGSMSGRMKSISIRNCAGRRASRARLGRACC